MPCLPRSAAVLARATHPALASTGRMSPCEHHGTGAKAPAQRARSRTATATWPRPPCSRSPSAPRCPRGARSTTLARDTRAPLVSRRPRSHRPHPPPLHTQCTHAHPLCKRHCRRLTPPPGSPSVGAVSMRGCPLSVAAPRRCCRPCSAGCSWWRSCRPCSPMAIGSSDARAGGRPGDGMGRMGPTGNTSLRCTTCQIENRRLGVSAAT